MSLPVYDFTLVPNADWRSFDFHSGKLSSKCKSILLRVKQADTWHECVGELVSLCDEVAARQAAARGEAFFNCPLAERYIDDRLNLDDPLKGYMIRGKETGCLQGYIVYTTFTMWINADRFNWKDPDTADLGSKVMSIPAGRKFCGRTFKKRFGGREYLGKVKSYCIGKSYSGRKLGLWHIEYEDGDEEDLELHELQDLGLVSAAEAQPKSSKISAGALQSLFRKPSKVTRLVNDLQREKKSCAGDAFDTGVVWPRVAEITLLGALRCGGWLLELVLQELAAKGEYQYVVLSATKGAIPFYEKHRFAHVGATAQHYKKPKPKKAARKKPGPKPKQPRYEHDGDGGGDDEEDFIGPVEGLLEPEWTGYRHFSYFSRGVPESYMMARRLHGGDGADEDEDEEAAEAAGGGAGGGSSEDADADADADADMECTVCGSPDDPDTMLLCGDGVSTGCDRGYHTYCLTPKLPRAPLPEGDWYCPDCIGKEGGKGKEKGKGKGKDGRGEKMGGGASAAGPSPAGAKVDVRRVRIRAPTDHQLEQALRQLKRQQQQQQHRRDSGGHQWVDKYLTDLTSTADDDDDSSTSDAGEGSDVDAALVTPVSKGAGGRKGKKVVVEPGVVPMRKRKHVDGKTAGGWEPKKPRQGRLPRQQSGGKKSKQKQKGDSKAAAVSGRSRPALTVNTKIRPTLRRMNSTGCHAGPEQQKKAVGKRQQSSILSFLHRIGLKSEPKSEPKPKAKSKAKPEMQPKPKPKPRATPERKAKYNSRSPARSKSTSRSPARGKRKSTDKGSSDSTADAADNSSSDRHVNVDLTGVDVSRLTERQQIALLTGQAEAKPRGLGLKIASFFNFKS